MSLESISLLRNLKNCRYCGRIFSKIRLMIDSKFRLKSPELPKAPENHYGFLICFLSHILIQFRHSSSISQSIKCQKLIFEFPLTGKLIFAFLFFLWTDSFSILDSELTQKKKSRKQKR